MSLVSMLPNPTERFTGRVENYGRFRPTYPAEVVDLLSGECSLRPDSRVADIAAGTGIFTQLFLAAGFHVTAVEPNTEMRTACATLQPQYPKLTLVDGTAEATGLPDHSIDLIAVAQAMHWFDLDRTRAEFTRILKTGGYCAILYNHRCRSGDPFHDGYEQLLIDYGVDYREVQRRHIPEERIADFFSPSPMSCATLPNARLLTLQALEGLILSASYMPQPSHARFEQMRSAVQRLFAATQSNGNVAMHYDCVIYYGRLL